MGSFWIYAFVLAVGVIIGMLIDNDTTYKVLVKKIKQKGSGNRLDSEIDIILPPKAKKKGLFKRIKSNRNERKENRTRKNR